MTAYSGRSCKPDTDVVVAMSGKILVKLCDLPLELYQSIGKRASNANGPRPVLFVVEDGQELPDI
jgi:hypothetical protein